MLDQWTNLLERKIDTQLLSWPGVKVENHVILVFLPPATHQREYEEKVADKRY